MKRLLFLISLIIHCYRMLGSIHDAEDLVQETYLRAWKTYSERGNIELFRPWLYKVATNACLDALRQRKRRALIQPDVPMATGLPSQLDVDESCWIEPLPDALIPDLPTNPEAIFSTRESVNLAFMETLHKLSPQHRAVLILRDVLGWKAREVAEHLEMSESAVNSATLRARKGLQGVRPKNNAEPSIIQSFLENYVAAWEGRDIGRLVGLLKQDVVMSMPPLPIWFAGSDRLAGFVSHVAFGNSAEKWRAIHVAVNSQQGIALYNCQPNSKQFEFFGIHALAIDEDGIGRIDHFMAGHVPFLTKPLDANWTRHFDLPSQL